MEEERGDERREKRDQKRSSEERRRKRMEEERGDPNQIYEELGERDPAAVRTCPPVALVALHVVQPASRGCRWALLRDGGVEGP